MTDRSVRTATPSATEPDARWRSHAAVLAFGSFAVGTDAFVIAGVLPSIAGSLHIGLGEAGQLVTVFALAYAIAAPLLGALTAGWPLRRVVLVAMTVFVLGNVFTAIAPTYPLVLASRIVAAVGAASYTASATATAAALAGEARRGRAIAVVMSGVTSSLVLGTPIGTVLGSAIGWRATLWFVAGLGAVAAVVLAARLPASHDGAVVARAGLRDRLAPLRDRRVRTVLACTFVAFLGIYTPYTYFSAVYEPSTGGSGDRLAFLLLVFGVAGTAGNLAAGALADRFGPRRVIVAATLVLTAVFAALPLLALVPALQGSVPAAVLVVVVSGVLSFAVTTPQQHLVIALAPAAGSVVTSLYQGALYLAISASGVLGAVGLAAGGAVVLGPVAALPVLVAALLTMRSSSVR